MADTREPQTTDPSLETLVAAMAADGIDLTDQEAVRRWLIGAGVDPEAEVEFDEDDLDFDEDDLDFDEDLDLDELTSIKDAFGLPDRLPPLRLPEDAQLAAAARTSRMLARARALAEWIGSGRPLSDEGVPTGPDCAAAAAALGLAVPDTVESLRDVPQLVHLWDLAESVELIAVDDEEDRMVQGSAVAAWPDGTDEDVLDIWATAFAVIMTSLDLDAELSGAGDEVDLQGVGGAVLVSLFLARNAGLPITELRAMVDQMARLPDSWPGTYGDPTEALLARLDELGATIVDGETVRLTPLAQWAMWSQLMDSEVEVPVLPPVEEMTAADLVAAAEGFTEEELATETTAWLALREPAAAAGELLDAAATGEPADRMFATSVVTTQLRDAAEPHWRAALDDPRLRAYAKLALELKPDSQDLAWLLTDVLAATSEVDGPEDIARQLSDSVPAGQEPEIFEAMWRIPHPDAGEVLTMLGNHHPDKQIAKAARKAAFKAASS